MDNFKYSVTDGKLNISLNLWGHFNMLFRNFQTAVSNISSNVEAIKIPNDANAQRQSRTKYSTALQHVNRYLDKELLKKGFGIAELGPNEAMSLFYAIRETIDLALKNEALQASESTYLDSGFTVLLNKLMGTRANVDKVLHFASSVTDEELIRRICEDINLRAIRARRA